MPNRQLSPEFREASLQWWLTHQVVGLLMAEGFVYDPVIHVNRARLPVDQILAVSAPLQGKSATDGLASSRSASFPGYGSAANPPVVSHMLIVEDTPTGVIVGDVGSLLGTPYPIPVTPFFVLPSHSCMGWFRL